MIINQSWITLVSASTALIASIAGPFVTLRVGRQQFKASVLSVNRQRWIESLRDALSSLVSQLEAAATVRQVMTGPQKSAIAADPALINRIETLVRTTTKIELLLNMTETDHKRLRALMKEANNRLKDDMVDADLQNRIDAIVTEIIATSQGILKREWIRVKRGV